MVVDSKRQVFQFKITLKGVRPYIWRRIQVPGDFSFRDFHGVIQCAMGWKFFHLHKFDMNRPGTAQSVTIGKKSVFFANDDNTILDDTEECISDYFTMRNKKCVYEYDMGDSWEHTINLEKILSPSGDNEEAAFPACLDGERACPPEDCGGVFGYRRLLKIIKEPNNAEYKSIMQFLAEQYDDKEYDPEHFDLNEIDFEDASDYEDDF